MARRLTPRQLRILDVAVVVVAITTGVIRDLAFPQHRVRLLSIPAFWYAASEVVAGLALLWRRSHPVAVSWTCAALSLISPPQAAYVAAYSSSAFATLRLRSIAAFLGLVAGWVLGAELWRLTDPVTGPVALVAAAAIGLWIRARRETVDALLERAERAELERDLLRRITLAEERSKLAAEVHDSVGHWISLMVLQAGSLEVRTTDPNTRRAAAAIGDLGGQAITELRSLLSLLRARRNEPARPPALSTLVDRARCSGLDVELEADTDLMDVPQDRAWLIYRVVREALTNATRHSPDAAVVVTLQTRDGEPEAVITNTASTGAVPAATKGGTGLDNMRTQFESFGGRMESGPTADGGFSVRATFVPSTWTSR